MAAIVPVFAEQVTVQTHTGDTDFVTVATLPSARLVPNSEYLLLAFCQTLGSASNSRFEWRLADGAIPAEIGNSLHVTEVPSSTEFNNYSHMQRYNVPATPVDVVLQHRTQDAARTVTTDTATILAIPLDGFTENTDFVWNEDDDTAAPTPLTTSWVDFASITFRPETAGHDWLVIALNVVEYENLNIRAQARIRRDGTVAAPAEVGQSLACEGEDTQDQKQHLIMHMANLDATEHTFAVSMQDAGAAGTQNDHWLTRIIALDLNLFVDHEAVYTPGAFTPAGVDTWEVADSHTLTPAKTGNFVIIGSAIFATTLVSQLGQNRVQIDGVTAPVGKDAVNTDTQGWDTFDVLPSMTMILANLDGETTVDLGVNSRDNVNDKWRERVLVCFSAELAPDFKPIFGQVIFNSADQENRPRYAQRIARGTDE